MDTHEDGPEDGKEKTEEIYYGGNCQESWLQLAIFAAIFK